MKRIVKCFMKTFVLWVICFGVLAYFYPNPFLPLKGGIFWFFALTMFGIGAVLHPEDFKRILMSPRIILIGIIAQYTIMPFCAWGISKAMGLSAPLMLGLVLAGSMPGAMTSNVLTYIANADTAYSVSLTTASTMLSPLLSPVIISLLVISEKTLNIPVGKMFIQIVFMVVIPLLAGFAIRTFFREKIEKILYVFPAISSLFIIFICALVIALNQEKLKEISFLVIMVVLMLNVSGMVLGFGVGKIFSMSRQQARTLSIEIGMQNAGMGTVLALANFKDQPDVTLPTAAFVFICIITASVMAEYWRQKGGI